MTPAPPDFLAALRRRGVVVGLGKQQLLGRLVACWQGEDLDAFRGAVAALLSTSPEEVLIVKDAFDRTWQAAAGLNADAETAAAGEPARAGGGLLEPQEARGLRDLLFGPFGWAGAGAGAGVLWRALRLWLLCAG